MWAAAALAVAAMSSFIGGQRAKKEAKRQALIARQEAEEAALAKEREVQKFASEQELGFLSSGEPVKRAQETPQTSVSLALRERTPCAARDGRRSFKGLLRPWVMVSRAQVNSTGHQRQRPRPRQARSADSERRKQETLHEV